MPAVLGMRRQLEGRPFVETFAADLSHELKNPVAAIRAAAEVLTGKVEQFGGNSRRCRAANDFCAGPLGR